MKTYIERESSILELKEDIPTHDQIVKTAIGMCNLYGGRIVIGVADDHRIVGISEKKIDQTLEYLNKLIYESCTPTILPNIYSQRIGDKLLLVIEISEGMNKPYFKTSLSIGKGTFMRIGRSTIRATPEMIEELKWQGRGVVFDELPIYQASKEDLDYESIKEFFAMNKRRKITDELLLSYRLLRKEQNRVFPTVGSILLFGKAPESFFSEAFCILSHFSGRHGRTARASQDCTGGLFDQFDNAFTFLKNSLPVSYKIRGARRDEKLQVPEIALREVLINAIVHRNYNIRGPIKIAIYQDRIEFFSPGLFPGPLSTDRLEQGITYIRNSVIAKIFREAGYIEKLGTGFITLFESYRQANLATPQVIEGDNFVKCILPRTKSQDADSSDNWRKKVEYLLHMYDEISVSDVEENLSISRSTAIRRLRTLVEDGIIKRIGSGRSTRYVLVQ